MSRCEPRLALGALVVLAFALAAPFAVADRSRDLRAGRAQIARQERTALHALYAQATSLERARLAAVEARAAVARLRDERLAVGQRLETARLNLAAEQSALSDRIVFWYKNDTPDGVAILLASESLQDALDQAETVRLAARQDADLVARSRSARRRFEAALSAARAAEGEARTSLERADASAAALADQVTASRELISHLRSRSQRLARRIDRLEATAATAARRTVERERATGAAAAGGGPAPAGSIDEPSSAPVPEPGGSVAKGNTMTVEATAYALTGTTASGLPTGPGICATDPSVIPLGTRFTIEGRGECLAADTGSAIVGRIIDIWMPSNDLALQWGRRTVTITFH